MQGVLCKPDPHLPDYTVTTEMPLRGTPPPPLSTRGNRLVNALTGNSVAIRGLNW
jgi:hypothetical protein